MTIGQPLLDGPDQRRGLHRRDQVVEEALLGRFESRTGGRLGLRVQRAVGGTGDPGGFERGVEVVMDDLLSRGGDNAKERGVGAQFP